LNPPCQGILPVGRQITAQSPENDTELQELHKITSFFESNPGHDKKSNENAAMNTI
jgi:hypothetical protein